MYKNDLLSLTEGILTLSIKHSQGHKITPDILAKYINISRFEESNIRSEILSKALYLSKNYSESELQKFYDKFIEICE